MPSKDIKKLKSPTTLLGVCAMDNLPIESILRANPHLTDVVQKTILFKPPTTLFNNRVEIVLPSFARNAYWTHLYIKLMNDELVDQEGNVQVGAYSEYGLYPPIYFTTRSFTNGWIPLAFPIPTDPLNHRTLKVVVQSPEPFEGVLLLRALAVETLYPDRLNDHVYVNELGDVESQILFGPDGGHLHDRRNQQELLEGGGQDRRIHYSGEL